MKSKYKVAGAFDEAALGKLPLVSEISTLLASRGVATRFTQASVVGRGGGGCLSFSGCVCTAIGQAAAAAARGAG